MAILDWIIFSIFNTIMWLLIDDQGRKVSVYLYITIATVTIVYLIYNTLVLMKLLQVKKNESKNESNEE